MSPRRRDAAIGGGVAIFAFALGCLTDVTATLCGLMAGIYLAAGVRLTFDPAGPTDKEKQDG